MTLDDDFCWDLIQTAYNVGYSDHATDKLMAEKGIMALGGVDFLPEFLKKRGEATLRYIKYRIWEKNKFGNV